MPTINCQNDPGWNEDTEMNVSVLFEKKYYILLMCVEGCLTDIFDPFVCDNQSFHVSARERQILLSFYWKCCVWMWNISVCMRGSMWSEL